MRATRPLVPQAGLEPARLSAIDFESNFKLLNRLILFGYLPVLCVNVLIHVLIYPQNSAIQPLQS